MANETAIIVIIFISIIAFVVGYPLLERYTENKLRRNYDATKDKSRKGEEYQRRKPSGRQTGARRGPRDQRNGPTKGQDIPARRSDESSERSLLQTAETSSNGKDKSASRKNSKLVRAIRGRVKKKSKKTQ